MTFSCDPPKMPLGTAGPIKLAENLIEQEDPFLVLNGDIFADLNYREIVDEHIKKKALATIALCKVDDPTRFGVAEIAENGSITQFVEKPPKGKETSNLINAGAYVLSPKVLKLIPSGRAVSMEREIFPKLAAERKLYGHRFEGLWIDVGKPEEYLQANRVIAAAYCKNEKAKKKRNFELKNPVALDKGITIGNKSIIGPYVVLGKHVKVGKNVGIIDSVIFEDAEIGDSAQIEGALIGEGAVIGENAKVLKGCIIGDQAIIKEGAYLEGDVVICPAKKVSEKMLKSKTIC